MLYYSSAFFGTVAIHSSFYDYYWMTPAFIVLCYLSTINWMGDTVDYKLKKVILYTDRLTAHLITVRATIDAWQYEMCYEIFGFYFCLFYTLFIYYSRLAHYYKIMHASMHFMSCLGCHLLIYKRSLYLQ